MVSIFVLLTSFVCLGLFARKYTIWIRLLLFAVVVGMVLYVTFG